MNVTDIDNDGDKDILLGIWGENSKLYASYFIQVRFKNVCRKFRSQKGVTDQLLAVANNEKYFPFLGKEEIEKQLPATVRKRYVDYSICSNQTVEIY